MVTKIGTSLIDLNTGSEVQSWTSLPNTFITPSGAVRSGATEGAQVDLHYLLVGRNANDPPSFYATVTSETFSNYDAVNKQANVTRVYQDHPAPVLTFVSWNTLVSRFTDTEWAGVQKAINNQVTTGNGGLARWIALSTVNGVDVTASQTLTYKAQLVTASILTQARADAIFVAP